MSLNRYVIYLLVCLAPMLCLGIPFDSWAQLPGFELPGGRGESTPIVTAHGLLSVDKVQPASTFQIAVVMEFAPEWHANANPAGEGLIPTELILPEMPDLVFGEVVYPEGDLLTIASLGKDPVPVYHEEAIIGVQATLRRTAQPRQVSIPLQLTYQACNDETCLLPRTIDVNVPVEIVGTDQSIRPINDTVFANIQFGAPPDSTAATSESGRFSQALSKGYFWAFLFVFVGGVLTSLTPCVYPLIPVTVGIFGANPSTGRLKSFLLSVTYVLGIALMYSILGIAVASTGAVFGQVMANPFVIGFVSAILIALGLSMLGVFEIRLPYTLQNKLNNVGGVGFAGAFAMGTVAGIIAAPCTGPALGAVLSYVATTGSMFLGFWLLLTYALGMGVLFILIGTFSGLIAALPRSGGWMYVLENIFGIAIIAVALYFLKEVIEPLRAVLRHSAGFFTIAGALLLIGILIGRFSQRFKDLSGPGQVRKALGVLSAVVGLYLVIGGLTTAESDLGWITDEAGGLEIARREGKPAMLDFYATWCGACNELDHKTYSDPAVKAKLSEFVNIKLDFSKSSDEVERLKQKYNIVGLPVVIFYDSEGNQLPEKRFEKFIPPEEFLAHVEGIE